MNTSALATLVNPLSALLLFLMALVVLLRERKAVSLTLAAGLLLLAVIQVLDPLAFGEASGSLAQKRSVLFLKSLMPVAFLLYGLAYRKRPVAEHSFLPFAVPVLIGAAFGASALVLPLELFFTQTGLPPGPMLPLDKVGYWFYLGLMIFCIAALVNLETVFTAIRGADRWRVKYEFLGVGAILGVFIFYFSQGLLYRSVNVSLLPVRSAVLAVFVAILTGVAFLVLLLSEEIRRRLEVFLAKNFYAQKHEYREVWLEFSNTLARCCGLGEVRAAIVERYEQIFGVRFAVLYARESGGDSFVQSGRGVDGVYGGGSVSRDTTAMTTIL